MRKQLYPKKPNKTKSTCPNCGFEIVRRHTFEQVIAGGFRNPENGSYDAVRTTPVREAKFEPDVLVPAVQSLVSALVTVLPTIVISTWFRWEWYAPLAVGVTTVAVSWFTAVKKVGEERSLVEEFSYTPTGNGGEPRPGQTAGGGLTMSVIHETSGIRSRMQLLEISEQIDEKVFGAFLKDIAAGRSLARRNWVGESKPFSRDPWDDMMAKLELGQIIMPVAGQGKKLTNGGRHAINQLVRAGHI